MVERDKFRSTRSLTTRLFQWFYLFFLGCYQFLSFPVIKRPMDRLTYVYLFPLPSMGLCKASSPRWNSHINSLSHPMPRLKIMLFIPYIFLPTKAVETLPCPGGWRRGIPFHCFSVLCNCIQTIPPWFVLCLSNSGID